MIIARNNVQLLVEVKLAKEILEAQIFTKEAKLGVYLPFSQV